jgi:hypothetical protein
MQKPIMLSAALATVLMGDLVAQPMDDALTPKFNPFRWPSSAGLGAMPSGNISTELPIVRAVMVSGSYRAANINGDLIQQGEIVNGYLIAKINQHDVVFRKNSVDYTVRVYRSDENSQ